MRRSASAVLFCNVGGSRKTVCTQQQDVGILISSPLMKIF